jgi:hypothetical protein
MFKFFFVIPVEAGHELKLSALSMGRNSNLDPAFAVIR